MSETKFTPGPLHVVREADEPRRYWIVRNPETWEGRVCMVPDYDRHDARAMAHLFAAAPELYDMLDLILPLAKGYRPEGQTRTARRTCDSWIEAAEAALAQARGETE